MRWPSYSPTAARRRRPFRRSPTRRDPIPAGPVHRARRLPRARPALGAADRQRAGPSVTPWMGPYAHTVSYWVRGGQLYHVVRTIEDPSGVTRAGTPRLNSAPRVPRLATGIRDCPAASATPANSHRPRARRASRGPTALPALGSRWLLAPAPNVLLTPGCLSAQPGNFIVDFIVNIMTSRWYTVSLVRRHL
jgi:hypothetical protein